MRRWLRVSGAASAACLLATASACSSTGRNSDESTGKPGAFKVSFANYAESAPMFRVIHTNLDTAVKKAGSPVRIKWYDNAADPAKMLQNVQLMVRDRPDAIVIFPVSNATEAVSKVLKDSRIPCVSINLPTGGCRFLNIDNRSLGIQSAERVGRVAAERGWSASDTTVLLGQNAVAGDEINTAVRSFYATLAPKLGMAELDPSEITAKTTRIGTSAVQFDGASQLQPSFQAVRNLLPGIPRGRHIILYTLSNDSTTGALRALEDAGRAGDGDVLVAGVGGDETGITALREDPRWIAEGDVFISWWGEYAVGMAQALAAGRTPPAEVTALPQTVLDKSSVDEYHARGSADVTLLPPLVPSNAYLRDSALLQAVDNIKGIRG